MVKFGNKLRELQVPEWKEHYIQYKMMKKRVRNYAQAAKADPASREQILKEFAELLDRQVEKSVLFLLEKQGQLANRLLRLGDEREGAQENADKMTELQEEYRDVGRNLLKLLHFMEMNATGLRKILKKFDKRVGYRLTDYYVATRSNHPYSQLQQVFRHVGIGALVGAIAHNLAELKTFRGSLIALYYDSPHTVTFEEPIIELIKSAEDRLTNSTSFLRFLGKQLIAVDELPPLPGEDIAEREYHGMSVFLNLANTFLYMVNTYIIVPTADKYALSLGAAPTLCGVIIGSMAVAQLVSSVYFSAWSNRSYFRPLIFSSIMLLLGNILYAVAYDFDSLTILILGRLLCGLGSARAVNRRYISDCVPVKYRLKASAAFVSASALGMACGPALAGVLEFDTTFLSLSLNANTLPGWVMAVAWVVYLGYLSVGFKEPPRDFPADPIAPVEDAEVADESGRRVSDLSEPLLKSSGIIKSSSMEDDFDEKDSYEGSDESSTGASFFEACRLLTKPVKVQLYIYFMLKFAMEILLSESSVVTAYYFHWGTGSVAVFLALLGLTVLPVNWVVGSYVSNMFEDRQILVFSQAFTCLGIVLSLCYCGPIPYTVGQYISGALLIFVSAEVLEGVNLSLLSRVMSSRLSRGTWNGGLLSTEAGTLARVVADVTITLAGYLGDERLLNVTLLPSLFFGVTSLFATFLTFNSLY